MQRSENMCQGLPSRDSLNRFFNRELSWLRFNRRVLAEAANFENPALERLKYLSITASNLDEFFMVRFAYLRAQTLAGVKDTDPSGLTPQEQLVLVAQDAHRFMQEQLSVWETCVLPDISHAGLRPLLVESLDTRQLAWLERRFRKDIQPQLTLLAEDGQAGWPPVPGRQLLLALLLAGEKSKKPQLVLVLPSPALPRTWKRQRRAVSCCWSRLSRILPRAWFQAGACSAAGPAASPGTRILRCPTPPRAICCRKWKNRCAGAKPATSSGWKWTRARRARASDA